MNKGRTKDRLTSLISSTPNRSCNNCGDTLAPIQSITTSSLSKKKPSHNSFNSPAQDQGSRIKLTDEIYPMPSHKQMTIPHQRRKINEPRIGIRDCNGFVEIVDSHETRVDVLDGCSCAHAQDFVGVYVADV